MAAVKEYVMVGAGSAIFVGCLEPRSEKEEERGYAYLYDALQVGRVQQVERVGGGVIQRDALVLQTVELTEQPCGIEVLYDWIVTVAYEGKDGTEVYHEKLFEGYKKAVEQINNSQASSDARIVAPTPQEVGILSKK